MKALSAVGQTYGHFQILKYLPIEELKCTLIELVHEPTGARVMQIANDDPENLFCLSLQTIPASSNGVAHILEHTVLCGSKKYPVKDPFFSMTRRSLHTFMNAFTGQDFTCYPAASQVKKDFYNLLEVYLDAIFHPELKELSFLQEAHRLTFSEGKLGIQGVVYNEMKGSMSSPSRRLFAALMRHLTPDLTYAYNSGGEPKEIPNLTLEELREFHETFYHPSRCLFFFYGNLPLSHHLDFIEKNALRGEKKLAPLPPLQRQPRFSSPVIVEERYPITGSTEKKAEIAFAWLTALISEEEDLLALCLLDLLLMETDASPMKKALLKSGLCKEASSSLDQEMSEAPWVLVCKGCDSSAREGLKKVLFDSLKKATKGFSKEEIDAALHQLEFERTEINPDGGPFGLTLFFRSALAKQHGCEPEMGLFIHQLFGKLRIRIGEKGFFKELIHRYFLDNPHFVELTMLPDPEMDAREACEEKERIARIEAKLTASDIEKIKEDEKRLAAYQEAIEHQSLDCLPKLSLSDVSLHERKIQLDRAKVDLPYRDRLNSPPFDRARQSPIEANFVRAPSDEHHSQIGKGEEEDRLGEVAAGQKVENSTDLGITCFSSPSFTNQVLYAELIFTLPEIPQEEWPLLALFSRLMTELGAGGRGYEENLAHIQAVAGGMSSHLSCYADYKDPEKISPVFSIRGKALYRNSGKLLSLFGDFIDSLDLLDEERIHEWLEQHLTGLNSSLTRNSIRYAVRSALSSFSASSFLANQWSGLPYYQEVQRIAKKDARKKIKKRLQELYEQLFSGQGAHLVLSCDANHRDLLLQEEIPALVRRLPKRDLPLWRSPTLLPHPPQEAFAIASPVAYTAYGMKTVPYCHADSPYLVLAAQLMENVVLHKEVREKGGAYGSGASYASGSGTYHFYSFRDPHLSRTVDTFIEALDRIADEKFNEQELEEAKFSALQGMDAPLAPAGRAAVPYGWMRSGLTYAVRDAFRARLLKATPQDISRAVSAHLSSQKKETSLVTYAGKDLLDREQSKLKKPLLIGELF